MSPANPRIYIAAPFFNAEQLGILAHIEELADDTEIDFFSPRQQHGNEGVAVKGPEDAARVFQKNHEEILNCTAVLAVLAYALPPGRELRQVEEVTPNGDVGEGPFFEAKSGPLVLPDAGTVWEMGVAYQAGVPVVGFHPDHEPGWTNLMITQSVVGLVTGFEELERWMICHAERESFAFQQFKMHEGAGA